MKGLKVGQINNFWRPAFVSEEQIVRVKDREALILGLLNGDYDLILVDHEYVKEFLLNTDKSAKLKRVLIGKKKSGYLIISAKTDKKTREAIIQANDDHMETVHR